MWVQIHCHPQKGMHMHLFLCKEGILENLEFSTIIYVNLSIALYTGILNILVMFTEATYD